MTKKRIFGVLFAIMICFIWGNSMLSGEISGAISHFIADLLGGDKGASDEGHFLLRKAAHFTEYGALAVTTLLFFNTLTSDRFRKYCSAALVGILTPLIDETIQIFSGRGAAITDIWIDIVGFCVGCGAMIFVFWLAFGRGKRT